MKDVPPEVAGQIALSVPLFALGLALFLTAFLLVSGALLSLIPQVYQHRPDEPTKKWKLFGILILMALVCAGIGWLTLGGLSNQLVEAATIMSNVKDK